MSRIITDNLICCKLPLEGLLTSNIYNKPHLEKDWMVMSRFCKWVQVYIESHRTVVTITRIQTIINRSWIICNERFCHPWLYKVTIQNIIPISIVSFPTSMKRISFSHSRSILSKLTFRTFSSCWKKIKRSLYFNILLVFNIMNAIAKTIPMIFPLKILFT